MSLLVKPNCRMYDFMGAQPPSATSACSHDYIGALASTDLPDRPDYAEVVRHAG